MYVNLQTLQPLVSFDVPVNESLQVIRNKFHNYDTFEEWVEANMELLDLCFRTSYFQMDEKFFQQKEAMAVGSSLSPIVNNIYMEHFGKLPLDSAQHKPSLWLRYLDDNVVVW
jgi:hypothetical protein